MYTEHGFKLREHFENERKREWESGKKMVTSDSIDVLDKREKLLEKIKWTFASIVFC